jgi:predicted enzyme related to lactoylglutathione lyase
MAKKAASKKASKKRKSKTAKKAVKKVVKKKKTAQKKKKAPKKATKSREKARSSKSKASKAEVAESAAARDLIGLRIQHVDFLTYKLDQMRKFYGDVLGFGTEQGESTLNYLTVHTSPSSSIGFMPPHPKMTGDQPPPREPTIYFIVEDVDKVFATLMARGVAFMGPPQMMPWGHRVVVTTDPEGRTIMLGSQSEE